MSYEELLAEKALNDERFVVMTAENRALVRGLPARLGERFIDTGITEQCMVGAAAGLALRGRIPIVHALAAFLTMRAFEFIRTDVGIGNLPVKLSGFIPGFLSDGNGPTHQAVEDVALMRGVPNMQVFAPADEDDLLKALPVIWESGHPSYIRLNTTPADFIHAGGFEIGKAEIVSEGTDVTVLTYGLLFSQALAAKGEMEAAGLSVGLVNLRSLKPLDEEAVLDAAARSACLVTLEDHFRTGGLYSIVSELLVARNLRSRVLPLDLGNRWFHACALDDVIAHEGFTGQRIAQNILREMEQHA